MTDEIWIPIIFAKKYYVSNYGRIKNNTIILNPFLDKDGYKRIKLYNNFGKRKSYRVHDVVAICFLGDLPAGMEVNHKDGNKWNNRPENLEIVTHKYNIHAYWNSVEKKAGQQELFENL
jgi:hypothetical protein